MQPRRRSTEELKPLLREFVRHRQEAHAALARDYPAALQDRFLVDLPRHGRLEGGWSFKKHGAGARLTWEPTGAVVDLVRLDHYREGEVVPLELARFLESIGVDQLESHGTVVDVADEAALGEFATFLERAGLIERREGRWILAEPRPGH